MPVHTLIRLFLCLGCLWVATAPRGFSAEPLLPPPVSVPAVPVVPATKESASAPLFTETEWNHDQKTTATPASGPAVAGKAVLGLCLSLAAIIAVAVVAGWVIKRLGVKRVLQRRGQHLDIIETVPLGFKRSLSLVRLGGHVLVIGQGEHELHHIATLPASVLDTGAPTTAPRPDTSTVPEVPSAGEGATSFRRVLDHLAGRSR